MIQSKGDTIFLMGGLRLDEENGNPVYDKDHIGTDGLRPIREEELVSDVEGVVSDILCIDDLDITLSLLRGNEACPDPLQVFPGDEVPLDGGRDLLEPFRKLLCYLPGHELRVQTYDLADEEIPEEDSRLTSSEGYDFIR